ncbi:ATP-dependent DNA helicase [Mycena chlorophos]|uniref:ATP-dependent DNA helicase n=1 Tax=Mycena chlorophos TaxID=658473 RepID=A0A8H6SD50_MYCCL|nr:ATP-dependent DNA helicase [Mycena chlorophos]
MANGTLMPRPVGILAAVVAVTFVGVGNVPLLILPDIFEMNNKLYASIEIDAERLRDLPEAGIPDEIRLNARYSEDESVLDREHAGYVPVDLGDETDAEQAEQDDRDRFPLEDAGGQEDEEREQLANWSGLEPVDLEDADDGDGRRLNFDARVFPLQSHGCVDVAGEEVTDAELFHNAAQNLLPAQRREYAVRPGSEYVNEYPRAFPVLFPYGLGGFEVDRKGGRHMLLLLKPWRKLQDLPGTARTFAAALDEFMSTATAEQHRIVENVQYFYDCSDRARQRREAEDEGEERRQGLTDAGESLPMTAIEEPTEEDLARARKERSAARERIYGAAAVEIAFRRGIFQANL